LNYSALLCIPVWAFYICEWKAFSISRKESIIEDIIHGRYLQIISFRLCLLVVLRKKSITKGIIYGICLPIVSLRLRLLVISKKKYITEDILYGIYLPTVSSCSGLAPTCTNNKDMIHGIPIYAYCSFLALA
jgi:hypothetical protein